MLAHTEEVCIRKKEVIKPEAEYKFGAKIYFL